ncbi:unnamed protein product [Ceratitis capitata]|uniref:(Mediterranean fruit fly) hypothetical protein n=1 Tax=Ceratitis capitata TaxID=7213 RepID=A0A811U1M6_CERCA|nr:unnamed protein product [Ceratitis capitata]
MLATAAAIGFKQRPQHFTHTSIVYNNNCNNNCKLQTTIVINFKHSTVISELESSTQLDIMWLLHKRQSAAT